MQWQRLAMRFLLFALIGLLIEVFFTAIGRGIGGDWNLRGNTSPWMMLDYGLLGVLLWPIYTRLKAAGIPLFLRAAVYMLGIFIIEYISGMIFTAFGLRIWNYDDKAYNLHGQITLLYAPFWYALGLVLEPLHRRVDAVAVLLIKGLRAEDLEGVEPKP